MKNRLLPTYISQEAQSFYSAATPINQRLDPSDGEAVAALREEIHGHWATTVDAIDYPFSLKEQYLGGVRCVRITTEETRSTDSVIMLLHGGAYVFGSPEANASSAIALAQATGIPVLSVDYRLAPENPYPAALNDSIEVLTSLSRMAGGADNVIIVGESAGAGLALSVCLALRDKGGPMPRALVLISPWGDLERNGDSLTTLIDADLEFANVDALYDCAAAYAPITSLANPLISPVNASLHDLPPLLIQVGAREILLSDSLRLAYNARAAATPVDLDVWDGMGHLFHAFPELPESKQAYRRIDQFIKEQRLR